MLDPLEDVDVGPIAELVGDPAVQLVMHAPAGDLLLFATRYGVRATNVFDTQLAAGFVGHGISMAYDRLVERALSVTLTHNETFSDWSRRPLTEAQIAYAADDVRYLFALADALVARLDEMGRRSVGRGRDRAPLRAGRHDRARPAARLPQGRPPRAPERPPARGAARGGGLARGGGAHARPAARLGAQGSERRRGRPPQPGGRRGARRACAVSATSRPRPRSACSMRSRARPTPSRRSAARELPPGLARRVAAASALGAVLVRARCEGAHIAPELVATRAELESFVEAMANGQDEHALLTGWRRELVGAELKRARAGQRRARARAAGAVRAHVRAAAAE